jgi:hypothetical protein
VLGGYCAGGSCFGSGNTSSNTGVFAVQTPTKAPVTTNTSSEASTRNPILSPVAVDDGRAAAVASVINNITLSGRTIVYPYKASTADSVIPPEELALQWLIEKDPLKLSNATGSDKFRLGQRYALLTLWFQQSVSSPWSTVTGWLKLTEECKWYGLTCVETDFGDGIGLQSALTEIALPGNDLNCGDILPDFGLLASLRLINFGSNTFTGTLPDGKLPASIGQWRSITRADFSYNLHTGTLPDGIGQWSHLETLDFSWIGLSGTLPESIGNWRYIKKAAFHFNFFGGELPASVGQWTNLESIHLHENKLTGTLPESVANWSRIKIASFQVNYLTGSVPSGICAAANLTSLTTDCELVCSCCNNSC